MRFRVSLTVVAVQCGTFPYDIFSIRLCDRCFVCKDLELCQRQDVIFPSSFAASKTAFYGFVFQIFDSRIHISCVDLYFVCITGIDVSGRKRQCFIRAVFIAFP